jgi:hypothetical protein
MLFAAVHESVHRTFRNWRDARFEFVVRSKADVGERNSDLLREVKLNGGRPMAMADSF